MSKTPPTDPASILCLGEALVDLICERPLADGELADSFRPHVGGAAANCAVATARLGARVSLAGGTGDDEWGHWLETVLADEGVDLTNFHLHEGLATPVAFVRVDPSGEPRFSIYGRTIGAAVVSVADELPEALARHDALVMLSNTLIGPEERAVSMSARELALEQDVKVCFDPNLRLGRWASADEAIGAIRAVIPDAFLVKCNAAEASLITGEDHPDSAARALVALGASNAVVTLGADGAILRGDAETDVPGVPAVAVNTTGAGDAFFGTLLGHLSLRGFNAETLAAAMPPAAKAGARATTCWPAIPPATTPRTSVKG